MRWYVKVHFGAATALTSRYLEDVMLLRKFGPHTPSFFTQEREQSSWKGDVGNGITDVDKRTSVSAHQLDERVSAWQKATDGPTDTHRTVRVAVGHDVGAGGTTALADAAFFPPFLLPLDSG